MLRLKMARTKEGKTMREGEILTEQKGAGGKGAGFTNNRNNKLGF